jgi:hypothetical protein
MSNDTPRFKKSLDEGRRDRASEDRDVTQNRKVNESDRLEMLRKSFFQSALPDLPKIPGYHVCWLTTTNPRDSIASRIRLGYEPVRQEDVPGWEYASVKTGEYAGCIGVNEMLAFKIPEELYRDYMEEWHHRQPREEEERLADTRRFIEEAQRAGVKNIPEIFEGDGNAELRKAPPRPRFDV